MGLTQSFITNIDKDINNTNNTLPSYYKNHPKLLKTQPGKSSILFEIISNKNINYPFGLKDGNVELVTHVPISDKIFQIAYDIGVNNNTIGYSKLRYEIDNSWSDWIDNTGSQGNAGPTGEKGDTGPAGKDLVLNNDITVSSIQLGKTQYSINKDGLISTSGIKIINDPNGSTGFISIDDVSIYKSDFQNLKNLKTSIGDIETNTDNKFKVLTDFAKSSLTDINNNLQTRLNDFTVNNDKSIKDLNDSYNNVSNQLNSFSLNTTNNLTSIQNNLTNLNSFTGTTSDTLTGIQNNLTTLNSFTQSTNNTLTGIQSNLTTLNSFTGNTKDTLTGIQSNLSSLNSFTGTTRDTLTGIQTNLTTLNSFTGTTRDTLTGIQSNLITLNYFTGTTRDTLTGIQTNLTTLNSFTGTTRDTLTGIQSNLASLNSFTGTIRDNFTGIQSNLNSMSGTLNSITSITSKLNQSNRAISIGSNQTTLPANSISIGNNSSMNNTGIVLNASSTILNPTNTGFFVQPVSDVTQQMIPNGIVTYNNTSKEIGFNSSFIPNGPRINLGNNISYYIDNLGNMVSNKSTSQMICMSPNFQQNINNTFLPTGNNVSATLISLSNTGQYQTGVWYDINGTSGNIHVSSDYGKSWTKKTTYVSKYDNLTYNLLFNWTGIKVSGTGQYQAAVNTSFYLFTSSNFGVTWNRLGRATEDFPPGRSIDMTTDGKYQVYISIKTGSVSRSAKYESNNFGLDLSWTNSNSWTGIPSTFNPIQIAISSDNGNYQLVMVDSSGGTLYLSVDKGNNWRSVAFQGSYSSISMSSSGQYQIAQMNSNIIMSNDFGNTWKNIEVTVPTGKGLRSISMSSSGQYMFYSTIPSGFLYHSLNYGQSWITITTPNDWGITAISGDGNYKSVLLPSLSQVYTNKTFFLDESSFCLNDTDIYNLKMLSSNGYDNTKVSSNFCIGNTCIDEKTLTKINLFQQFPQIRIMFIFDDVSGNGTCVSYDSGKNWSLLFKKKTPYDIYPSFPNNASAFTRRVFASDNNKIILFSRFYPDGYYTFDLTNWTKMDISQVFNTTLFGVLFSNNMWIAVGMGTNHTVAYSLNGINWIGLGLVISLDNISMYGSGSVEYGNNLWIIWARNEFYSSPMKSQIMYSSNGTTWTNLQNIFTSITDSVITSIKYVNGVWISLGVTGKGTFLSFSTNGTVWSPPQSINSFQGNGFVPSSNTIAYGNGKWVICDGWGAIAYATTFSVTSGFNFTIITSRVTTSTIQNLYFMSGLFYILTSNSTIYTSSDGITWTIETKLDKYKPANFYQMFETTL